MIAGLNIIEANQSHAKDWDNFVATTPQSSIYHWWHWRSVYEQVYGLRCRYFACIENKQITGVLPLAFVPGLLSRGSYISLPYGDYAGLLYTNEQAKQALLHKAKALSSAEKKNIEFRQIFHEKLPGLPSNNDHVLQFVDTSKGIHTIWNSFTSNHRRKIRKSEKNKIVIERQAQAADVFWPIYAHNMHYLGTPHHSLRFFKAIEYFFSKSVFYLIAKWQNQPIGAMLIFRHQQRARDPWTSTIRSYNHLYTSHALYFAALQYACDEGLTEFDFGRSQPGSGTYEFKAQWNCQDRPLLYQGTLTSPSTVAKNTKAQQLARLWSKLPFFSIRLLAPIIRKRLA